MVHKLNFANTQQVNSCGDTTHNSPWTIQVPPQDPYPTTHAAAQKRQVLAKMSTFNALKGKSLAISSAITSHLWEEITRLCLRLRCLCFGRTYLKEREKFGLLFQRYMHMYALQVYSFEHMVQTDLITL